MPLSLGQNEARVDLTPTVDELGRPVLLVSAEIEGRELANDQILMPLSDLVGTESGCAPDGLHLASEGKGDAVLVGATETRIGGCDSPTQFLSDAAGPLGEPEAYPTGTGPGEWCAGGMGDPALSFTGAPTDRAHLLLDCSEDERSDEIFRFLDFAIGGSVRSSAWVQRTDGAAGPPQLFGASPSKPRARLRGRG